MGGESVILLDTQMWLWWVINSPRLKPRDRELIETHISDGLGVSDPGDEIIAATSHVLGLPLLTADEKLLNYEYVVKLT